MSNIHRGHSIDVSYHVSVHLAKRFQRRWLKCEKLTDDRRSSLVSISFLAHLAKGNVSFCHHLASVVYRPLTFHILIFSSETKSQLIWNLVGSIDKISYNHIHFVLLAPLSKNAVISQTNYTNLETLTFFWIFWLNVQIRSFSAIYYWYFNWLIANNKKWILKIFTFQWLKIDLSLVSLSSVSLNL
jgi:hypothetical protein